MGACHSSLCDCCSIMLNILGEGSGPEGEQACEQLIARAMQVSPALLPSPPPPPLPFPTQSPSHPSSPIITFAPIHKAQLPFPCSFHTFTATFRCCVAADVMNQGVKAKPGGWQEQKMGQSNGAFFVPATPQPCLYPLAHDICWYATPAPLDSNIGLLIVG